MPAGFGVFGKMPAIGDFFQASAPPGFVRVWDDWLQRGMMDAQAGLGTGWDALYLSAPIWRFCLAPGLAGPGKVIGVLMPSVDRVGRRFPLTLMAALPTAGPAPLDHFAETALFRTLEDVALDALSDDMTRDALLERLAQIAVPDQRSFAPTRAAGDALVLTQGNPAGIAGELAAGLLAARYAAPSIWSAELDGIPRMMVCDGLPQGPQVLGLYDLNAALWTQARPL